MSKNFDRVEDYRDDINNGEAIVIIWCATDVKERAKEKGIELTQEKVKNILESMKRRHDACIGINWDVIDTHIDFEGANQ